MRGVIGKAETQICKIAATLHIAKEWSPKGKKNHEISVDGCSSGKHVHSNYKVVCRWAANEGGEKSLNCRLRQKETESNNQ